MKSTRLWNFACLVQKLKWGNEHVLGEHLFFERGISQKDKRCLFPNTVYWLVHWLAFLYIIPKTYLFSFNSLVRKVSKKTHFKNLPAFAARFLKCIWPFWVIMHKGLSILQTLSISTEDNFFKFQIYLQNAWLTNLLNLLIKLLANWNQNLIVFFIFLAYGNYDITSFEYFVLTLDSR